ncbi:MAG: deoxyguanosinetriphosphate triphosphohydrolase [Thermomicrobiales bacterium]
MPHASSIRVALEAMEDDLLAPRAKRSRLATRRLPEDPSSIRTEYQRDRDRVIHSKSFRRLMHKTQVFIAPSGDHYRTRLTHTLEVTQIARTIGRALRLNEDLIEAIGLGHDLGHTPFGHAGEIALADLLPGFRHNEQSLRIVDYLEKGGRGLNLTNDARDGILRHSKPDEEITGDISGRPSSLEGEVVKISDGIAYINHDLDDSIRAGIIEENELPRAVHDILGTTHARRIDTLVRDVVAHSSATDSSSSIQMSSEVQQAANELRRFLFQRVYNPLNERPDTLRAQHVVRALCAHFLEDPARLPEESRPDDGEVPQRGVADNVASMTDRFALELYQRLFVPRYWSV